MCNRWGIYVKGGTIHVVDGIFIRGKIPNGTGGKPARDKLVILSLKYAKHAWAVEPLRTREPGKELGKPSAPSFGGSSNLRASTP